MSDDYAYYSDRNTVDFETQLEIGSFEYLPRKFLGIDTKLFGATKNNPFLSLVKLVMEDTTISFDDKCQAIRYLCHIPYRNGLDHLKKCCESILSNEDYDLDARFYFFANNEKYFKLEDNLVYEIYPYFFRLCIERNYPYFFSILSAKYIMLGYDRRSEIYIEARQFLYNIISDTDETLQFRYDAIDTLLEFGEEPDKLIARERLNEIAAYYDPEEQKNYNIYNNIQNVHDPIISDSIKNILRNLIKDDLKLHYEKSVHIEDIHNMIISRNLKNTESLLDTIKRIILDPSKFEGKTLHDILIITYRRILSFNDDIRYELINRLIEELTDMEETCSSGHLSRLVNIFSGYIADSDYNLKISDEARLRSVIFAKLNYELRKLPSASQEEVILAMGTSKNPDDPNDLSKMAVEEFVNLYEPYDEIKLDFIDEKGLSEEQFDNIYKQTIAEYIGN